jgi:nitrate/nitrite-specific signal transduction histidine kinase
VLELKPDKMTDEQLVLRAGELEREIHKVKQAEKALRRQNEYLTALHETSIGLIDHLDKEELLEAVLQRATELTGTEHGYIYLHEPGEDEIQMQVGMGFFKNQLGLRVKKGVGMGGKVWESEQPLVVEDYRSWKGRISDKALDEWDFL